MKKALIIVIFALFAFEIYGQTVSEKPSKITFSFTERIRLEAWDNTTDLNNLGTANNAYMRFRTSVGMQWKVTDDLLFNAKVTNEFRKYIAPKTNRFHWNELFFDNLYMKVSNILPGTLIIGRQDISLGEGFIIKDGTPGDGSRSVYFNAVKFDWMIDKTNTLTLLAMYQPYEDNIFPILNGLDIETSSQSQNSYRVEEQTESGAGAYYSGDFGKTNVQGYYFWKNIKFDEKKIVPESAIHTFGSRIKTSFADALTFTGEAALQFGTFGAFNRSAYGGYAYLDYKTSLEPALLPKTATVGTIVLSGDDVSTTDYEGWDPLFSRWPKWSDSYVYTQGKEFGRTSYWSNLFDLYFKLEFSLMKDLDLTLQHHILTSLQKSVKTSLLSGDGTSRGNLSIVKLGYKMSPNVNGRIIWEYLEPGSYYFKGADNYNWFQIEMNIAI